MTANIVTVLISLLTLNGVAAWRDICSSYTHIIKLSKDYNQTSDCVHDKNIIYCKSFTNTLQHYIKNNTCIVLESDMKLNGVLHVDNVSRLMITSSHLSMYSIYCNCNATHSNGLKITSSFHLVLSNLKLFSCGFKHDFIHKTNVMSIWQSVFIHHSKDVTFINMTFQKSCGYACIFNDVVDINLHASVFEDAQPIPLNNTKDFTSLGGIFFKYSQSFTTSNNSIVIDNKCLFQNNRIKRFPNETSPHHPFLPYGNGAGVSIFLNGNTSYSRFVINAKFYNNSAIFGGGVHVHIAPAAVSNVFIFSKSKFISNSANLSGGGVYINQEEGNLTSFEFLNVLFQNNSAIQGGAMTYSFSSSTLDVNVPSIDDIHTAENIELLSFGRITNLKNCTFENNTALIGSSLNLLNVLIKIDNVIMIGGKKPFYKKHSIGNGAIYTQNSVMSFYGVNNISHNEDTAFILDCSKIWLKNHLTFYNNSGYDGGALALYGHSQLVLSSESNLTFLANNAENKGGAMFVDVPGPQIKTWIWIEFKLMKLYSCFLWQHGEHNGNFNNFTGSVHFIDNTQTDHTNASNVDYNHIYASTLQNCLQSDRDLPENIITSWRNFHFTPNKNTRSILTRPIEISSNSEKVWNQYPGFLFDPKLSLLDERRQLVDGTINIKFDNDVNIETNPSFAVTKNKKILLTLTGKESTTFNIYVTSDADIMLNKIISGRLLMPCTFGLRYDVVRKRCMCDVKNNMEKGVAVCGSNELYLFDNRWLSPLARQTNVSSLNGLSYATTHVCPLGYCSLKEFNENLTYTPLHLYNQCDASRDQNSRLCSKCKTGLSVPMGSEQCKRCDNNTSWIWVSFIIIVGLSVLIFILLVLNIDVMSFFINPVLYSYQVMDVLWTPQLHVSKFLQFIISISEFTTKNKAYPTLCMWQNMDNLQKMAINYIIPVWMLLLMIMLFVWTKLQPNSWISRERCLRTFTIIGLMIYSDFARISFWLLKPVNILGKQYVYIYADVPYFVGKHIPYAITAICIILFFVLAIPLLLLFSPCINSKKSPKFSSQILFFQSIILAFSIHVRKRYTSFLAFFYICRLVIFSVGVFYRNDPTQYVVLSCICLLAFIVFSAIKPFKVHSNNYIEMLLLANLTLICMLSLGIETVYNTKQKEYLLIFANILSYIPLLLILLVVLGHIIKKLFNRFKTRSLVDGKTYAKIPSRPMEDVDNDAEVEASRSYYDFSDVREISTTR